MVDRPVSAKTGRLNGQFSNRLYEIYFAALEEHGKGLRELCVPMKVNSARSDRKFSLNSSPARWHSKVAVWHGAD